MRGLSLPINWGPSAPNARGTVAFGIWVRVWLCAFLLLAVDDLRAAPSARLSSGPHTFDAAHLVEGTATAAPGQWHLRLSGIYLYDIGLDPQTLQTKGGLSGGVGLPLGFELSLAFDGGYTQVGSTASQPVGRSGGGPGDLRAAALWSKKRADVGGFSWLLGVAASAPLGDAERYLGEEFWTVEPFVTAAFELFAARLVLQAGYRVRRSSTFALDATEPEVGGASVFEHDDEIFWGAALRIPKRNDVAVSFEAGGVVPVAVWSGDDNVDHNLGYWLGGGFDFPVGRHSRFGFLLGGAPRGTLMPDFFMAASWNWLPVEADEDEDGVPNARDACRLLPEDRDNFEDEDGCPELDNDKDGFPDDEDRCPLKPAVRYSDDGC